MVTVYFKLIALWAVIVEDFRVSYLDCLLWVMTLISKEVGPLYSSHCQYVSDALAVKRDGISVRSAEAMEEIGNMKFSTEDRIARVILAVVSVFVGIFIVESTDNVNASTFAML